MIALAGVGVASISMSSAFISSGLSCRPARTEWWQAMVELALQRLRAVEPRRRFAQQRRTGAERLDDEAERFELGRLVGERRQVARLNERLPIGTVRT